MKKWLKNAKGLTLVELLAVIVILGVIAAIAVPSISGMLKSSKYKADVSTMNMVVDAATRWSITDQADGGDGAETKTIAELVSEGFLAKDPGAFQSNSGITIAKAVVSFNATTKAIEIELQTSNSKKISDDTVNKEIDVAS